MRIFNKFKGTRGFVSTYNNLPRLRNVNGSALFNPNKKAGENLTLCKPCHEHEQEMIGEKWTNDIPELLALYSPSERLDED